jgi:Site-specific recombinase XerD
MTIDTLDKFRTTLEQEGKSERTVKAYVSDVETFLHWQSGQEEHWDTPSMFLIHDKNVGPATIGRRRSSLKAYYRIVHDTDPLMRYKAPPPPPGKAHPLPNLMDDVRAMLDVSKRQARVAIALCGFAGLRIDEARTLRPNDINLMDDELTVLGKGGKTRYVPIAPELRVILTDHLAAWSINRIDDPILTMTDRGVRSAITRAGEKAGISRPVSSHDLRMTFGTVVYDKTKDLRVTQELLGHADPRTTERYTGITEASKRNAVKVAMS